MAISVKRLSKMADEYYTIRQHRLAEQKKVDAIEEKEKKLKVTIMAALQDQHTKGVTGSVGCAELIFKQFPKLENEEAAKKFAKKKGNEDIFKTTLNATAVKERWEAGIQIPGIVAEQVVALSITKV